MARAVNYVGAAAVKFIAEGDEFYFTEMASVIDDGRCNKYRIPLDGATGGIATRETPAIIEPPGCELCAEVGHGMTGCRSVPRQNAVVRADPR